MAETDARTRRAPKRRLLAALLALAFGLSAAPAQASFFAESLDPAGDSSEPANPGRDLTAAGLGYDRLTGSLVGSVRLAGEPSGAPALVTLFAGSYNGPSCNGYPAVGFSAETVAGDAYWHRLDGVAGKKGFARTAGASTTTQTFTVDNRTDLEGVRPNCAVVVLSAIGDSSVIYDAIGPLPVTPQPQLGVELRNVPQQFAAGRARQVKIRVTNPGDARSKPIKLRFKQERGVRVAPKRLTVKPIEAGKRRTVTVRVTVSSRADFSSELTAIAESGRLEARDEAQLYRSAKRKKGSGGGGGGSGGGKTCVRWIPDFSGESGGSLGLLPC